MMNRILAAMAMASVFTFAGIAQSAAMESRSCADFSAMDSAGKMEAMEMAMMAPDDHMAADDQMSSDDQMASEDEMASDDQMASEGQMASDDRMALQEKTASACADNPDMMLKDAVHEAMGQ